MRRVPTRAWMSCGALLPLLLLLPGGASAQEAAPRDTVRLRFDWKPGLEALVEVTTFRVQVIEGADTSTGTSRYRMSVSEHPEGLLISASDHDFALPAATGDTLAVALLERMGSLMPKTLVSRAGDFIRIEDIDQLAQSLEAFLAILLDDEDLAGEIRTQMQSMLSPQMLTSSVIEQWTQLVAMWRNADLEIGSWYSYQARASSPLFPGVAMPLECEFTVEKRVSCTEDKTGNDCVEIRFQSYLEPEATRAAIDQYLRNAATGPSDVTVEEFRLDNEVVLVTDPETLLPHRVFVSRQMEGIVTAAGERETISRVDVRTYQYRYQP